MDASKLVSNPLSPVTESFPTPPSGARLIPALPLQDLSGERVLRSASRMSYNDSSVPCLGKIPLLAKLGQGGMGAVYYGIHPRLDMEVAVKVLPSSLVDEKPELVQRFCREGQIAAKVKSPHLVSVIDVNEENGVFYLVMEYVKGRSAHSYLRQIVQSGGKIDPATALDICIAATAGLAAAHAEGIIHRDVKPDNVMIPSGKTAAELLFSAAKLADLGLARSEGGDQSLTGTQCAMGTPGFMAPEQASDAKKVGKAADIFSMGATLYTLLCGQPPFVGSTNIESILAAVQKPHTPVKVVRTEIPLDLSMLVDRCLNKSPERRFQDGSALLEALRTCRASVPNARGTGQIRNSTIGIPWGKGFEMELPKPGAQPAPPPGNAPLPPPAASMNLSGNGPLVVRPIPRAASNTRTPLMIGGGLLVLGLISFAIPGLRNKNPYDGDPGAQPAQTAAPDPSFNGEQPGDAEAAPAAEINIITVNKPPDEIKQKIEQPTRVLAAPPEVKRVEPKVKAPDPEQTRRAEQMDRLRERIRKLTDDLQRVNDDLSKSRSADARAASDIERRTSALEMAKAAERRADETARRRQEDSAAVNAEAQRSIAQAQESASKSKSTRASSMVADETARQNDRRRRADDSLREAGDEHTRAVTALRKAEDALSSAKAGVGRNKADISKFDGMSKNMTKDLTRLNEDLRKLMQESSNARANDY